MNKQKLMIGILLSCLSFESQLVHANLSELEKHILAFSEQRGDSKIVYSGSSIGTALKDVGSEKARLKGTLIHKFNAVNSGKCPISATEFNKGEDGTFGYTLHLGTARVWNADGSINEARLSNLLESTRYFEPEVNDYIVQKATLKEYIAIMRRFDPVESTTGRYESKKPFSKKLQYNAADGAWDEVFNSLKSGVVHEQPYILASRLEQFFRDTRIVTAEIKAAR